MRLALVTALLLAPAPTAMGAANEQVAQAAARLTAELAATSNTITLPNGSTLRKTRTPGLVTTAASDRPWQVYTNYGTDLDIDILDNGTGNGVPLLMWFYQTTPNQLWHGEYADTPAPLYRFRNALSGKCMDVVGPNQANGTTVHQWECGYPSQTWQLYDSGFTSWNGKEVYFWMNTYTGKCLDVRGADPNAGARLQIWDCGTGVAKWNQLFY
ncbi:RICIN domain-containing protein [Nonomuraea angiospora]|uniref:RICIN domain-containing protein n=1 Tax=Nonomuraea angiospora TaxID=46172 RepID=UPI00344DB28F